MSFRKVLIDWLEIVDPDSTDALNPDEQREFCADWYSEDVDTFYDAIIDSLSRTPGLRTELITGLRNGDFLQMGAVMDKILRSYLIGSEYVEGRLREVQEQESVYRGDE